VAIEFGTIDTGKERFAADGTRQPPHAGASTIMGFSDTMV